MHLILASSGITDSHTTSTPLDPNVHFTPFNGVPLEDVILYRQLVGNLIYLTVIRPYIAYVVHIVSQFMLPAPSILLLFYASFTMSKELWSMVFSSLLNLLLCYLATLMQIVLKIPLIDDQQPIFIVTT